MEKLLRLYEPLIQFGFAGFSMALLGLLTWTFYKLSTLYEKSIAISCDTNSILEELVKNTKDLKNSQDRLTMEMYKRPCIAGMVKVRDKE